MNYKNYFKKIENDPEYREAKERFGPILDIGDEVLRLRIEKGWSQAELAERAGTKQANISRLESGLSNPSVRFLQKVAKALDAKISVGFEREVFFAVDYSTKSQEAIQIRNWPQPTNLPKITTTSNKSVTASFDLAQRK
ncbi:MAG TPA: helix-turn-helix transcriptional regulator [Anaerolineales bacterium]|nr:helix-turn-helix transcriptional regulator [Anaerolineales bacterium]